MNRFANRMNRGNRKNRGFSLAEAMVAIGVLSVGVLSLARLVPYATRNDYGSRTDATGTFIAMRELEQMIAQPWGVTSFTDAADGNSATAAVNMSCACADPCTTPGEAGAPFVGGTETINYSVGAVNGYQRTYTIVQATGNTAKINMGSYDVRWHITCYRYYVGGVANGGGFDKIVVAARPSGSLVPGMIPIPAHIRAVRMK